jgi:DNA-binding response OmpR family regulator
LQSHHTAPLYPRGIVSGRARLLVVDDDPGIRQMLTLALAERGYDVTTTDGRARLEVAGYDLVLLDARLGGRTAADVAAAGELAEGPPVLLMTAALDAKVPAQGVEPAGAIAKPFDLVDLFAAIEQCLAEPSAGGRPPAR